MLSCNKFSLTHHLGSLFWSHGIVIQWSFGKGGSSMPNLCSSYAFIAHYTLICTSSNQLLSTTSSEPIKQGCRICVGSCRVFGLFWGCCKKIAHSSFNPSYASAMRYLHPVPEGSWRVFDQKKLKIQKKRIQFFQFPVLPCKTSGNHKTEPCR
jgi:hypothetical protein